MAGILFDTCGARYPDGIWYMMENHRVAAFGEARHAVEHVHPGDIVFFYHPGHGLVAAATVVGEVHPDGDGTLYRDVEFVTPIPARGQELMAMPAQMVSEITGLNFFFAATLKKPFLVVDIANQVVEGLRQYPEQA